MIKSNRKIPQLGTTSKSAYQAEERELWEEGLAIDTLGNYRKSHKRRKVSKQNT
jgi:hypothetical protein